MTYEQVMREVASQLRWTAAEIRASRNSRTTVLARADRLIELAQRLEHEVEEPETPPEGYRGE